MKVSWDDEIPNIWKNNNNKNTNQYQSLHFPWLNSFYDVTLNALVIFCFAGGIKCKWSPYFLMVWVPMKWRTDHQPTRSFCSHCSSCWNQEALDLFLFLRPHPANLATEITTVVSPSKTYWCFVENGGMGWLLILNSGSLKHSLLSTSKKTVPSISSRFTSTQESVTWLQLRKLMDIADWRDMALGIEHFPQHLGLN